MAAKVTNLKVMFYGGFYNSNFPNTLCEVGRDGIMFIDTLQIK